MNAKFYIQKIISIIKGIYLHSENTHLSFDFKKDTFICYSYFNYRKAQSYGVYNFIQIIVHAFFLMYIVVFKKFNIQSRSGSNFKFVSSKIKIEIDLYKVDNDDVYNNEKFTELTFTKTFYLKLTTKKEFYTMLSRQFMTFNKMFKSEIAEQKNSFFFIKEIRVIILEINK